MDRMFEAVLLGSGRVRSQARLPTSYRRRRLAAPFGPMPWLPGACRKGCRDGGCEIFRQERRRGSPAAHATDPWVRAVFYGIPFERPEPPGRAQNRAQAPSELAEKFARAGCSRHQPLERPVGLACGRRLTPRQAQGPHPRSAHATHSRGPRWSQYIPSHLMRCSASYEVCT